MIFKKEAVAEQVVLAIVALFSARETMQNFIVAKVETPEVLLYRIPKEYHTLADVIECAINIIDKDDELFNDNQRIELIDSMLPLVSEIGILGTSLLIKRESLINKRR
jgi:hypothetical protein